jgi:hypothetical protein
MTRRLRDLLRLLPDGWRIERRTGGGHLELAKPGKPRVFAASTPSDPRSWRNTAAMVRRHERMRR